MPSEKDTAEEDRIAHENVPEAEELDLPDDGQDFIDHERD